MNNRPIVSSEPIPSEPVVAYAVSDMTGETAQRIVRAASAHFAPGSVAIKVLRHIGSAEQVVDFIREQGDDQRPCAVFHTIVSRPMSEDLRRSLQDLKIPSVDLLWSTANVIAGALGEKPQATPGLTIEDGSEPLFFLGPSS